MNKDGHNHYRLSTNLKFSLQPNQALRSVDAADGKVGAYEVIGFLRYFSMPHVLHKER